MTGTGRTSTVGSRCELCRKDLGAPNPRGRLRRFCDARCRSKARRQRTARRGGDPAAQPFATAVRAAIGSSGQSLRELAAQLDDAGYALSPSTLSQWGMGHHLPRLDDDMRDRLFMLERLAWVSTGTLVRALLDTPGQRHVRRAPRVPGPKRSDGRPCQCTTMDARRLLLDRIGSLFGSDPDALTQVAHIEHYVLGPRHLPVCSEVTITVAAVTGTPDRYWYVHTAQAQEPLTVVAGAGCTLGIALDAIRPVRVNSRTPHQPAATELRFDRPLTPGGEHTFSFTVHYGLDPAQVQAGPAELWALVSTSAMRELRVSIAFHPAARPRRLHLVRWPLRPGTEHSDVETIPVDEDGNSEPILAGFPKPGWYGYQWDRSTPDPPV